MQNAIAPALTVRRGGRTTSTLRWTRNDILAPQGAFQTNLSSVRMAYNVSPLINTQALIQYNDRTRRWSTNMRFT